MLILLLGPDDFSKKQYVGDLAAKSKAGVEFFAGGEARPGLEDFFGQDLFSRPKAVVLQNLLAVYEYNPDIAGKLAASKNIIIFSEEKVDRRTVSNKAWLASKKLEIKEFNLPHAAELDNWIIGRVKYLGGNIAKPAAAALAKKLGRDDAKETKAGGKVVATEEIYNLWQADSEIQKLLAYARGREITGADVDVLAAENREADVFELTNAIGENQKLRSVELLHRFLREQTGSDEKGVVIKLNAILAEQFRSVAMVQDFAAHKTSEEKILEATGWKPGRLFIMKKIASRFPQQKVLDCLNKLAALDEELKTSSTPPRVLLDLIVGQLLT